MLVDFTQIEDIEIFTSVTPGLHLCRIAEVRETETRDGDPRWALRLEVAEGEYAGRTAAWDGLVWSERGLRRVKSVLEALGFDIEGSLEVAPAELVGRRAMVQLQNNEWEDPVTGIRQQSLRVPFLGFRRPLEGEDPLAEGQDGDMG